MCNSFILQGCHFCNAIKGFIKMDNDPAKNLFTVDSFPAGKWKGLYEF